MGFEITHFLRGFGESLELRDNAAMPLPTAVETDGDVSSFIGNLR